MKANVIAEVPGLEFRKLLVILVEKEGEKFVDLAVVKLDEENKLERESGTIVSLDMVPDLIDGIVKAEKKAINATYC